MLQRGLHVVSNDECLLLHSVRVTRAETDTVLCSEVMHLSYNGKRLHPRYRHKLQCNQLAFTWEKHTHYINKHSLLYTGGKASFEVFEQIHLRQKCPSPGSCHTPQWTPDGSSQQRWERTPPAEYIGLNLYTHTAAYRSEACHKSCQMKHCICICFETDSPPPQWTLLAAAQKATGWWQTVAAQ